MRSIEKITIRRLIKFGCDYDRKNGGKVVRKDRLRTDDADLLAGYIHAVMLLKQGLSVRKVMKLTGKSSGTVQKIKVIQQQKEF